MIRSVSTRNFVSVSRASVTRLRFRSLNIALCLLIFALSSGLIETAHTLVHLFADENCPAARYALQSQRTPDPIRSDFSAVSSDQTDSGPNEQAGDKDSFGLTTNTRTDSRTNTRSVTLQSDSNVCWLQTVSSLSPIFTLYVSTKQMLHQTCAIIDAQVSASRAGFPASHFQIAQRPRGPPQMI